MTSVVTDIENVKNIGFLGAQIAREGYQSANSRLAAKRSPKISLRLGIWSKTVSSPPESGDRAN
jgi:hypothetical protein